MTTPRLCRATRGRSRPPTGSTAITRADIKARRFHEARVHAHTLHCSPVPAAVPGSGVWVRMRTPAHPLWWEVARVLRCSLPA